MEVAVKIHVEAASFKAQYENKYEAAKDRLAQLEEKCQQFAEGLQVGAESDPSNAT